MLLLTGTLQFTLNVLCADDNNLSFHVGLLSLQELHSSVPRGLSSLNKTKHSEKKAVFTSCCICNFPQWMAKYLLCFRLLFHSSHICPTAEYSSLSTGMPVKKSFFFITIQITSKG